MDVIVNYDSPSPLREVDEAWFTLASRFGLFAEDGTFLLLVNLLDDVDDIDLRWARVRLNQEWTVAGDNPATINGPGKRGLCTMSAVGDVVIVGTTYEEYMSVLAVPDPHRASAIKHHAEGLLRSGNLSAGEAENVKRWLERT
ncbi:hypothetical protein [Streptomyces sp. NPDC085540]|uniref:hypothetical protein n=1 Tax=Streptomyces sp. NPDC085540 TaxID=3365730 RepID=UPI0037CF4847